MTVRLDPEDFAHRAAKTERWDDRDWHQWEALLDGLERLGATRVVLHGPSKLFADPWGPIDMVDFDLNEQTPTLAALVALYRRLERPSS